MTFCSYCSYTQPVELNNLKRELDTLRQKQDASNVDTALAFLRQQLTRPRDIFDPYTALAALEQLVDAARDAHNERANRYNTILKQTRPLVGHPALQQTLLKLTGSKDDVEVSKEIHKALKNGGTPPYWIPRPGPRGPFRASRAPTCFSCGGRGHFQRNCWRFNKGPQGPNR